MCILCTDGLGKNAEWKRVRGCVGAHRVLAYLWRARNLTSIHVVPSLLRDTRPCGRIVFVQRKILRLRKRWPFNTHRTANMNGRAEDVWCHHILYIGVVHICRWRLRAHMNQCCLHGIYTAYERDSRLIPADRSRILWSHHTWTYCPLAVANWSDICVQRSTICELNEYKMQLQLVTVESPTQSACSCVQLRTRSACELNIIYMFLGHPYNGYIW